MSLTKERWQIAQEGEKLYWRKRINAQKNKGTKDIVKEYWERYLGVIEAYIQFNQETNILEIGCGGEDLINYINSGNRCALDSLMDYFLSNFEMPTEVNWKKGVGEELPYKNEHFDVVISTNTLDHTKDPKRVLIEIKRVLDNNGHLVLTVDYYPPFLRWAE